MKKNRILLVSTSGGHLAQILEMRDLFKEYEYLLVTEDDESNYDLKQMYNVKYLYPPGEGRNYLFWITFLRNFIAAFKIIIDFKPRVIITAGSHTAIPFCYIGKLFGVKIIYILSYARIYTKALSASIVYPIADLFVVQWESAKKHYKKAKYYGGGLY